MKHKCFAAVVLAAALLLTGCGGAAAPAAPAGSGAASQSAAGTAVQTAQKERITDQWSLEKTVRGEMIGVMKLSIHVPQLVCDSPDAAALNEELAAMYAAEYMDYESDPDAEVPQGEECSQTEINWDAYWYGDCVSLVMRSHDYDDAPWYYSGWCFDFATGRQITTAEMLQHMGLDPDEVQAQVQRQAMQTFDREMAQGAYYEGLRSGGNLSEMRMGTLEYNELENCVCFCRSRTGWCSGASTAPRPTGAAAAGCGDPADLRRPRRYPGADRYLRRCAGAAEGNAEHHHPEPCTKDQSVGRHWHPGGTDAHLPHPWRLQLNMWMCASGSRRTASSARWSIC